MQNLFGKVTAATSALHRLQTISTNRPTLSLAAGLLFMVAVPAIGICGETSDPVLNLLLEKGVITQQEADTAKAQADQIRSNYFANLPPVESKWKIDRAVESVELFGDIRLRYEHREAQAPGGEEVALDRGRYSVRVGLRGKAFDDFYFGVRLDTSANPRSAWGTFGASSSGVPYNGPYGKANFAVNFGQVYLGWKPTDWLDITVGKMANPLYTTPLVWDRDLTPEGAAEKLKYRVGNAEFFATFGQFLYQDTNPNRADGGLGYNGLLGQTTDNIFQIAWQAGLTYDFNTNVTAKAAATLYKYYGMQHFVSPYFGDNYVGEGAFLGDGILGYIDGSSGYGTSYNNPPGKPNSFGFPNNQVGLNHLMVLEVPFEVNFKFNGFDARLFGDFAYNLEGADRAKDAAAGYDYYLANFNTTPATISGFKPQTSDVKAYQFGVAFASSGGLGLVDGSISRKHAWEARTYWQHVEQYALDPNILDSDFFEGRANLEGLFVAAAYGVSDNVITTVRYGFANRINSKLGTGGSNQDIPQINPVDKYQILQLDLTLKF